MTRTAYVVGHSISWAAQTLVDSHGADAGRMAMLNAQRMAEEGRIELATMWELVQGSAQELLGDGDAAAPVMH
jgi:translation initiation factor IF-3